MTFALAVAIGAGRTLDAEHAADAAEVVGVAQLTEGRAAGPAETAASTVGGITLAAALVAVAVKAVALHAGRATRPARAIVVAVLAFLIVVAAAGATGTPRTAPTPVGAADVDAVL